ncbi:MAG: fatty acid desaturase CarF family protein [Myxococcota bacterium]
MRQRRRPAPRSPAGSAWLDRIAVLGFASVWSVAAVRLAWRDPSLDRLPAAAVGVLAGYLLADFIAGLVHWLADRHFDPETPVIGPLLIAPFRAHHDDPLSITRHHLFEVLGNNALITLPVTAALLFFPPVDSALDAFAAALALVGTLASVATNLFHAWAHAQRPPWIARWLQRRRLVLTPRQHARHHRGLHDQAYCVTSGWLNPLLDRMRFFAWLDARLARSARPLRDGGTQAR